MNCCRVAIDKINNIGKYIGKYFQNCLLKVFANVSDQIPKEIMHCKSVKYFHVTCSVLLHYPVKDNAANFILVWS